MHMEMMHGEDTRRGLWLTSAEESEHISIVFKIRANSQWLNQRQTYSQNVLHQTHWNYQYSMSTTSTSVTNSSGGQPPLRAALTHQQSIPNGDQEFRTEYLERRQLSVAECAKAFCSEMKLLNRR